jgi:hypothetical protein
MNIRDQIKEQAENFQLLEPLSFTGSDKFIKALQRKKEICKNLNLDYFNDLDSRTHVFLNNRVLKLMRNANGF